MFIKEQVGKHKIVLPGCSSDTGFGYQCRCAYFRYLTINNNIIAEEFFSLEIHGVSMNYIFNEVYYLYYSQLN